MIRAPADIDATEAERRALGMWHIGCWTVTADADGKPGALAATDGLRAAIGIDADTPMATFADLLARVPAADRSGLLDVVTAALADGLPFETTHRVVRADAEVRWLRVRGERIGPAGGPAQVIGASLDTSPNRLAEQALAESEARFKLAQETAAIGTWEWDIARDDVHWSAPNYALWGYPRSDRDGRLRTADVIQAIHGEDRDRLSAELAAAMAGGARFCSEFRVVDRDGQVRWLSGVGAWRPEAGTAGRMLGVNIDITATKRAEAELESRVAARTAELRAAQEQLAQAQRMEAVGRLTGGIAHDFNNLLTAMMGSFELIARRAGPESNTAHPNAAHQRILDPKIVELARHGLMAADRGARLTAQLLAFSRTKRLELAPVDVDQLLTRAAGLIAAALGAAVRVVQPPAPPRLRAMADGGQLELALLNVAMNARDAMPGGGTLTLTATAAAGHVVLTVAGTGMDEDVRRRAMEPFPTTKDAGRGSGPGLAQVHGIVHQAGGTVEIDSAPGGGSTVRLVLPRAADAPPRTVDDAPAAAASGTLLVVDDDEDVCHFVAGSLRAMGFGARTASGGQQALGMLDGWRPDALVVDFAMPGMNGAEVATAARQRHPGLPVVFTTGYADSAVLQAARQGAPVLRKPFSMAELETAVRRALAAHATA